MKTRRNLVFALFAVAGLAALATANAETIDDRSQSRDDHSHHYYYHSGHYNGQRYYWGGPGWVYSAPYYNYDPYWYPPVPVYGYQPGFTFALGGFPWVHPQQKKPPQP